MSRKDLSSCSRTALLPNSRPVVGVVGSGSESHEERAAMLGEWLAVQGVHLLTGGGGGVMEAVCRAFCAVPGHRGVAIGIIPGEAAPGNYCALTGYPNPWVELPVFTHLPQRGGQGGELFSRNHINVLTSAVIVAFPGQEGTASEVHLAVRYARPLIAYVDHRIQIPNLPLAVPATADFKTVCRFILKHTHNCP